MSFERFKHKLRRTVYTPKKSRLFTTHLKALSDLEKAIGESLGKGEKKKEDKKDDK